MVPCFVCFNKLFEEVQSLKCFSPLYPITQDKKEYAKENEFADMENLCSDKFPYISVRKAREKDGNLKTSGGIIYSSGKYVAHCKYTSEERLVNFNKQILRFPTNTYYDYEHNKSGNICGEYMKSQEVKITWNAPYFKFEIIDVDTAYEWNNFLKEGDKITILGTGDPYIDTVDQDKDLYYLDKWIPVTCVAEKFEKRYVSDRQEDVWLYMYVTFYNKNGEKIEGDSLYNGTYESVTVKKTIPNIVDACVLNNRVFGVDKKGQTIYASKLGSFEDWYSYEGISTDSWYGEVGTEGAFTGIVEFNGSIIAFKRDYIYKIYGDNPKNFTIQKQSSDGCIDKKSIVELNGRLYFLSQNGFCVYSGGYPTIISEVLNKQYINAIGGTDGRKIYFYATTDNNERELLVYDTVYNMWHKESTEYNITCFFRYNGKLYFPQTDQTTNATRVFKIDGDGFAENWMFKTPECNVMGTNYTLLSDIVIYATSADKTKSCNFNVYIMYDGAEENEKKFFGSFMLAPNTTQRIPLKLKQCFSYSLLLEGTGPIVIKNIEKTYTSGGKNEGNRG